MAHSPSEFDSGHEGRSPDRSSGRGQRTEKLINPTNSSSAGSPNAGASSSSYEGLYDEARDEVSKIGRYRSIRRVGEGGMAEVYLAHDEVLSRDVALKVLRRGPVDEELVERFRREARSAASLSHSNIVPIYDWGEAEDGSYYLVMEYVPGGTVKGLIDREGPLPPERAVSIVIQTARALETAHKRGLVHRDIKPQNMLLDAAGDVKVTDFGIARIATTPSMTEPGSIVGTAFYISPEQASGDPVGPESDLYSLGVVLYEMLTGQVPYDAEEPVAILMQHLEGDLRPPKELNPEVPEKLDDITVRLLARDRENRYADASSLIDSLKQVRSGAPAAPDVADETGAGVSQTDVREVARTPEKRRRPWFAAVASLVLLVVVVAGLGLWLAGSYSGADPASFLGLGPEMVEVPDVTGETREAAEETLASKGFEVETKEAESSAENEGMVVGQTPNGGELESGETVGLQIGQGLPPEKDEELLRREVREYYGAVDRGEWSYTYSHLDSKTRALFTEEEWAKRNQFLSELSPGELSSMRVAVDIVPDEPADVTVYRTFKSGGYNVRDTLFLYEDGMWKHRLTNRELEPFRVNLSYEEFVSYYGGS